ncbi:neuronal acetylcholine receptor subunit alpha-10-like [Haliotis cracherodii]|uniref:neuronal acetylcholine receptor subunit alpha-10-like n=1 Tax=Haliotis cracherodii TaxID=6455 RepID=UPI0039E787CA
MMHLSLLIILQGMLCIAAFNRSAYPYLASEQQLMRDLLDDYEASVRPAENATEPIQVSLGIIIVKILDLNEKNEYLEMCAYLRKNWHDLRLKWNKKDYSNVDSISMPSNLIWLPDIVPYNNVESQFDIVQTMVRVYASGHVNWMHPVRLRTLCQVDLSKFPFDEQVCSIQLSSWTYSGTGINISLWGGSADHAIDLGGGLLNSEWKIISSTATVKQTHYSCCPEPYPDMMVTLTLRRSPAYYAHIFVIPALLLGVLVPFQLLLPPESKERLTLGSVLILSVLLLSMKLQDVLPDSVATIPAIEMYYMLTLIWVTMSMLASIWVLNVHNRGPRRGKVPDIIRWIFLRSLKRLVCLGSDNYYPLDEMETITMRGLDKSATVGMSSLGDGPMSNQDSRPPTKLERDVDDILKQVHLLTTRAAICEARQEMLSEWHQVALVMDRVLFFLFMLIFLMCSVILLT